MVMVVSVLVVNPFQLFLSSAKPSLTISILQLLIDSLSNKDSENQYPICGEEIVMKLER